MIVIVATDEEYKLAKERFKRAIVIKTGVGGTNVVQKLKKLPKWLPITNFGYAGSNKIPIRTECYIDRCSLYHPNVEYLETHFSKPLKYKKKGDDKVVPCYTSGDFVTETKIKDECVFDMELAYILAMGFRRVKAIKIISDSLNLEEYEESVG